MTDTQHRERYAVQILSGLLANSAVVTSQGAASYVVDHAVQLTDTLLEKLKATENKERGQAAR
jgi:hypothetical protein